MASVQPLLEIGIEQLVDPGHRVVVLTVHCKRNHTVRYLWPCTCADAEGLKAALERSVDEHAGAGLDSVFAGVGKRPAIEEVAVGPVGATPFRRCSLGPDTVD